MAVKVDGLDKMSCTVSKGLNTGGPGSSYVITSSYSFPTANNPYITYVGTHTAWLQYYYRSLNQTRLPAIRKRTPTRQCRISTEHEGVAALF